MLVKVETPEWSAEIILSDEPGLNGLIHAYAVSNGNSKDSALAAVKWVIQILAARRECYVRVAPEADSERDFDTKEMKHRGFTRFSFSCEPGEWTSMSKEPVVLKYLGEATNG